MNATQLYTAGELKKAIEAQFDEVRENPQNHNRRTFLFELLAFAGDLDRAGKQLDVINFGDMERDFVVHSYRKLMEAEAKRRQFFAEGLEPKFLAEAPEHAKIRIQAIHQLRAGNTDEAVRLFNEALEKSVPIKGFLNDKPFETLLDVDGIYATILEVFANGNYFWVPMEHITTLTMSAPKFPRDLLYVPARLEMEGSMGEVFIPNLYPESFAHADEAIKLGRKTEWVEKVTGLVVGLGSRLFLVGDDEVPLLEWRQLEIGEAEDEPQAS